MRLQASTATAQKESAPGAWGGRRGQRAQSGGGGGLYSHCTSPGLALAIAKRGRTCVVAKVVPAAEELVLAIPYRHRPRLRSSVSLPPSVLRRAREMGATALVVRDDREGRAWRLPLALAWRLGRRGRDGELYIPLAAMQEVAPPAWAYVERVELVEDDARQLPLLQEVGP